MSAGASWPALGSTAALRVDEPAALDEAVALVAAELARFDAACSRFREDSELSIVNARAGRPVEAGPLLLDAVELALRGAQLTDGALDPTIGLALEQAGYDRDWELLRELADTRPETVRRRSPRAGAAAGATSSSTAQAGACGSRRVPSSTSARPPKRSPPTAPSRRFTAGSDAACSSRSGATSRPPARRPAGGWEVHVTDDHRDGPDAPGQRLAITERRARHLEHDRPPMAARRRADAPHHRPGHRAPGADAVAHRQRRSGRLRGREHRQHRRAAARIAGAGLAARAAGCPPGSSRVDGRVVKVGAWPVDGEQRAVARGGARHDASWRAPAPTGT